MIAVPASRTQVPFVKLEGVSMLWTQRFEISYAHINPKTSILIQKRRCDSAEGRNLTTDCMA